MTLAPVRRPARAHALAPGQLVEFFRPSPRGGRGVCRGAVVLVKANSVVVRCTDFTVIGLPVSAQLRLASWEVFPVPPIPPSAASAALRPPGAVPGGAGGS